MKKIVYLLFLLNISLNAFGQTTITGKVTTTKGEPITGTNIYLKGTYTGTTTDENGTFTFTANPNKNSVLVASFIGYKTYEQKLNGNYNGLVIVLKESSNNINAVTITAGSFDASDETKSVTMRPLDIVTTASGEGDVYGALNTMPGTQSVGEEGGLFVRGGEGYETKTYMDGMLVKSPYSSSMPDVPARGKFSPFLFSGTMFSTGGYSAEYGQALSSALILKTNALPEKDVSSVTLLSVGLGASHTKRWDKTSLMLNVDYSNLSPYYQMAKQDIEWYKAPESLSGSLLFRQKIGEEGMIKSFVSFSSENSKLDYFNVEQDELQQIGLKSDNIYINTIYNDMLSEKWQIMVGASYNYDNETIKINQDKVVTLENTYQLRARLTNFVSDNMSVKYGIESIYQDYDQKYHTAATEETAQAKFNDTYLAAFVEPEFKISSHFAARLGGRMEHSNLNNATHFQPRVSLASKLTTYSQLSIAYGTFQQMAQNDFRKFNNDLKNEQATHYILNYQYVKKERTFRIEAYYKEYKNLVKYQQLNLPEKDTYNNLGHGFAQGVDVFWRDRNSIKNFDYYLSYSYVDTKRDYHNYPTLASPRFTSEHNFAIVTKYWFDGIDTQIGATYSFLSGRPYHNPNKTGFMTEHTPVIHDLSINASHLRTVFGKSAIFHVSVSNVLGLDKTYNYRYPNIPNEEMVYIAHAIKPAAKRFVVAAFILSL